MSQKRKRINNNLANNDYLANEDMFNRGKNRVWSEHTFSKVPLNQLKYLEPSRTPKSRKYNSGQLFRKKLNHISNFDKLTVGKSYIIGTGDYHDHAYLYEGTFRGVENGKAVFDDYSQINRNGKKYDNITTTKIKPLTNQAKDKRHIYNFRVLSKLPKNTQGIIHSFVHGNKASKQLQNKQNIK